MIGPVRDFRQVWFVARREKRAITETVLMMNDEIRKVRIGPRGGWKFIA